MAERGFYLDAGTVVWTDFSGTQNDALQADSSKQPTPMTTGGRSTVAFANTQFLAIADHPSLRWGTSDFALTAVLRYTNPTAEWTIVYAKWIDTPPYSGLFLWANYPSTSVTPAAITGFVARVDDTRVATAPGPYNDDALRLVTARRVGNLLTLRVNGTLIGGPLDITGFDAADFDAVGRPVFIGGRPEAVQAFHGEIAELVAIKGPHSDAELDAIETMLRVKYGL